MQWGRFWRGRDWTSYLVTWLSITVRSFGMFI